MRNKGSVLIASLWALSLFSVLMTSLTFEGFQHTYLMKRELESLQSKAEFQSALGFFHQALLTDPKPHEDSSEDAWYGALDLPEPWKAINNAMKALKVGGSIVCYSPTTPQMQDTITEMNNHAGLTVTKIAEISEREWEVKERKVRPMSQSIGHSGFIMIARKIG